MWKFEKLEQQRQLTHQLVEAVQSKIIDHILAARTLRMQLDANVEEIRQQTEKQWVAGENGWLHVRRSITGWPVGLRARRWRVG
jgi:hypothetical protein